MIKKHDEYDEEEILLLRQISPAVDRYLKMIHHARLSLDAQLKHLRLNGWLEAAFATKYKTAPTREVCLHWSKIADQIIIKTAEAFAFEEKGLSVFALGKLGASELNLSSDIDLIIFSQQSPTDETLKAARDFALFISSTNEFGPGFRVDLDLRPGGKGSPIVCDLKRFQDYYWTQSELWERMALVRLRDIYGNRSFNDEILGARDQFCFRKYLDYSLLEELRRLRPKIHASARYELLDNQINLKLTPGFIRDIELFISAHQILYGGREPSLRTTSTETAARQLASFEKHKDLFKTLIDYYWSFRQWENQVQAVNDFQTHDLNMNKPPQGWDWPSENTVQTMSLFVDHHISALLGRADNKTSAKDYDLSADQLMDLGFSQESVEQVWPEVIKASVLSRQKDVDESKRMEVIHSFIHEIANSAFDKDLGLNGFKDFLSSIRAKATFFHLLSKEQKLIKDLSFLFGLSPYLGSLLSNRPELVDSFLFNRDEPFSDDMEKSLVQMAERKSIAEIKSAIEFLSKKDLRPVQKTLTETADAIAKHLMKLIQKEVGNDELYLLALGKWGGEEIGFKSDLDFIFVSSENPTEEDHRFVRRFISRMRDTSAGGSIYAIDTRLKPSGKGGPLIVKEEQLAEFLQSQAQPWERQAYLKGRWINKAASFQEIYSIRRGLSSEEKNQLLEIRNKLILTPQGHEIPIKFAAGGITDIELTLQTLILEKDLIPKEGSTEEFFQVLDLKESFLFSHYQHLRQMEQLARILSVETDPILGSEKKVFKTIAKIYEQDPEELFDTLKADMKKAGDIIHSIDPIYYKGESS